MKATAHRFACYVTPKILGMCSRFRTSADAKPTGELLEVLLLCMSTRMAPRAGILGQQPTQRRRVSVGGRELLRFELGERERDQTNRRVAGGDTAEIPYELAIRLPDECLKPLC